MELEEVQRWIDRYVEAWRSNDPGVVADLFAADARYFTTPYREPRAGRKAILDWWLAVGDEPGSWECAYEARAVTGDVGVVTGWTGYASGEKYHNAYVIRFDRDGRAVEFTEWWMIEPREGEAESE